jgi:hypothetical protein
VKPYTVTVASAAKTSRTHHPTEIAGAAAYCRAVIASRGRDVTVTLTWTPRPEQGMFGIHMPVQTIATCTWQRKN